MGSEAAAFWALELRFKERYSYNVSPGVFALLLAVFILTAVDFTLTRAGLVHGVIEEGNPLLAWVMECQMRGSGVLLAIGLGIKFVAQHAGDWVKWPMLLALVSGVVVLGMHLR